MIETPRILQTASTLTAFIHLTIPRREIRQVMGPGLGEVMAALKAQGISPVGPWFTHHWRIDASTFDFEICVPVSAVVAAVGRVQSGELPAARVARTVLCGDYEGLGTAWGELNAWIEANGHTPRQDFWECYLTGPEASADPSAWRTELNRPLLS
jgi:effector-binding domain-containing protein